MDQVRGMSAGSAGGKHIQAYADEDGENTSKDAFYILSDVRDIMRNSLDDSLQR